MRQQTNSSHHPSSLENASAVYVPLPDWLHARLDADTLEDRLDALHNQLEQAPEQSIQQALVLQQLALAYQWQGNKSHCQRLVRRYLRQFPETVATASLQAWLARCEGQYDLAQQHYRQALYLATPEWKPYLYLEWANLATERVQLANEDPNSLNAMLGLMQWAAGVGKAFWGWIACPGGHPNAFNRLHWGLVNQVLSALAQLPKTGARTGRRRPIPEALLQLHYEFPGSATVALMVGDAYWQQGRYAEASVFFEKCLKRYPAHVEALKRLVNYYQQTEDHEMAQQLTERLLTLQPTNVEAYCHLATLANNRGEPAQAVRYFKKALLHARQPEWKGLILQSLAQLYLDQLYLPEAACIALQQAAEWVMNPSAVYLQLSALLHDLDDYAAAEQVCHKAARLEPDVSHWWTSLGYLAWKQGRLDDAEAYYRRALRTSVPSEVAMNNLAVLLLDHLNQPDEARQLLQEAVVRSPDYALAHFNLGRVYSQQHQPLKAAACFQKAKALNGLTHEVDLDELQDRLQALFQPPFPESNTTY